MIELIPLKQDSLLVCRKSKLNILKLMLGIVNESIEACEAFLNKKYVAFDGQVGDTSCQIRAYKISLLAHNQQFITKIQNLVLQIFDYKNNLINQIQIFETYIQTHPKYFKELDQKESKEIFFNKLRAVLPIDEDCL
ncbi:MAG TPA: hypothetical protein VKR58_14260, partial [Aquella sp.]|nr:hypothetical protein [Aquella sp.]